MGYIVKIQKVERPTNQSFYLNFPSALAQCLDVRKGESFQWIVENKNLILLKRLRPKPKSKFKALP